MKENILQEVTQMLDSYTGRDKVIRTLCYTTKLIAGIYSEKDEDLSKRFAIFSTKMSQTRATLRLLDDLPMLQFTLDYGFGHKEPDRLMAIIGTLTNMIDHIYYPIDKICWLGENKIIKISSHFDTLNSLFWVTSIYLNLMKTIRCVIIMQQHRSCVDKLENESSAALTRLLVKQRMEMISVFRLTLDFVHATSTLPTGWLWGGKIPSWQIGAIGTISSFIGLYQYFAKKKIAKDCN